MTILTSTSSYLINNEVSRYQNILKEYYADIKPADMVLRSVPVFAMIGQQTGLGGKNYHFPVQYGYNQGVSGSFSKSRANATIAKDVQFTVWFAKKYSSYKLDRMDLGLSDSAVKSFCDIKIREMDNCEQMHIIDIANDTYGNGTGSFSSIGSVTVLTPNTTARITLTNKEDLFKVFVNEYLEIWDTTNSTQRGAATTFQVTQIDSMEQGSFVVTSTNAALTSLVAGDLIFRDGNRSAPANNSDGGVLQGFQAWIPKTLAANDNFYNVNRNLDRDALAGVYMQASGANPLEAVNLLVYKIKSRFKMADQEMTALINPLDLLDIINQQSGKLELTQQDFIRGDINLSFRGVRIPSAASGVIKFVEDYNCPRGLIFVLSMSTWSYIASRTIAEKVNDDGLIIRRTNDNTDSYEVQWASYINLICTAPGHNGIVDLR